MRLAHNLCIFISGASRNCAHQKSSFTGSYAPMLIRCDERNKVIYVTPGGDLVAEETETMHRQIREYLRHDMETIVLDLARVRTIDSIGLSTIIVLCKLICKGDGELIIENASRELKKYFQLTRIAGRLTISGTGWPR
jgi:anti-anti-sigma factor